MVVVGRPSCGRGLALRTRRSRALASPFSFESTSFFSFVFIPNCCHIKNLKHQKPSSLHEKIDRLSVKQDRCGRTAPRGNLYSLPTLLDNRHVIEFPSASAESKPARRLHKLIEAKKDSSGCVSVTGHCLQTK
ncbi:hypothetical protein EVAR_26481_1 [Eumeta japonica]|uniref:Uncharacterized protein n=1 Tax=Eumeta variegata TaxID=151549 RepID=A0A4C1V921_EUMVA|nr:hypothetical protein EVAR_26481_1 [Eumeta japonica]